jgi:dUTP pyrophosphatase
MTSIPMKVKVKKLSAYAVMPTKAHATDAGFDLTAICREFDKDGNIVYHFGLALEIPEGYVGLIFPRSSICKKDLTLSNAVGVVDAGYRGEIIAKFKIATRVKEGKYSVALVDQYPSANTYLPGERVAQLIILPIPEIQLVEALNLSDTDRGQGGYGST